MDGIVFFREGTRGWQRSNLCILNNDGLTNISKNPTSFTILHRSFKAVSFVSIGSVRLCCMRKLLDFYDVLTLTLFTVFDMLFLARSS